MPISSVVATTFVLGGAVATDQPPPEPLRLADQATLSLDYAPAAIDPVLLLGALQDDLEGGIPSEYVPPPAGDDAEIPAGEELELPPPFGTEGTRRWQIHAGYAVDVKDTGNYIIQGGVGFSQFIADGLSLDLEFNGLNVNQEGGDAVGVNFNVLFRWHFLQRRRYTLYVDGGAGMLYTTDESTPANGSEFNFTPQAGVGVTYDLGNDVRLLGGVKWHHISNAELYEDNPGRDNIMMYTGVSFPF